MPNFGPTELIIILVIIIILFGVGRIGRLAGEMLELRRSEKELKVMMRRKRIKVTKLEDEP